MDSAKEAPIGAGSGRPEWREALRRPLDPSDEPNEGIFERRRPAAACVRAFHDSGFDTSQVGFAGPGVITTTPVRGDFHADDAIAAAATGSLAGGVVGGVLGAVVAGLVPGIGPIIAGGMLAGIAAGAPAGAAIGGIGAAL